MLIYIYNLLSMPIYGLILKNKKTFCYVASFQMFVILALRDVTIGMDLANYYAGYEYIGTLSFNEMISKLHLIKVADLIYPFSYESGYVVINWIISHLGFSFHGFLVIVAAFTMISVGHFIYKYSTNCWISYTLFAGLSMYTYSFGILRQTIAVCLMLWAVQMIENKQKVKFLLCIFVAFMIHRTAIIVVPLCYLSNIKITKNLIYKYFLACLAWMFIAPAFYSRVISFILSYLGKTRYINSSYALNKQIVLMFTILLLTALFCDENIFSINSARIVMWGYMLSLPIEVLGMCNDSFARIIEYFFIFAIILIPLVIYNYGFHFNEKGEITVRRNNILIIKVLMSWIIVVSMMYMMISGLTDTALVPYKFY